LAIMGVLTLVVSFLSTNLAYRGDYPIGGVAVAEVAANRPEVLTALRGIRGTSAAFAAAYAVLFLSIVFGPYKRGETWAWWALLAALLVMVAVVALRVPLVGTRSGLPAALVQLGIGLLGLLLDVGRLKAKS
jgi:hypothetical protein